MSDRGSYSSEESTLTGGGLQVWGDVRLGRDGVIGAKVKGNVRAFGKLVISAVAEVSGLIEGQDIRLEGKGTGGLEGRGKVWLGPQSVLRTRCVAKELRIEPGADFRGELRVEN